MLLANRSRTATLARRQALRAAVPPTAPAVAGSVPAPMRRMTRVDIEECLCVTRSV
jgi:hypothetical protein